MRKLKLNPITDNIIRLKLIKQEYIYKIYKSIVQNNNISVCKKQYIYIHLNRINEGFKRSQRVNTCLVTGSRHSITHKTNFCRQQNKRFIILGKCDNLKLFL